MYTSQGKLALVNLSSGEVTITCTPQQLVEKYLGGRGLNMYYLHKLLKPGVDPLSSDNVLIIGAGLLTGTLAPNSSRINITAKSPESGILGDANMGGFFGAEMRLAGFDRLIILGKAPAPVYLYLEDGELEIRPADPYWGYNVNDTQKLLRRDIGSDIQVACISRAGEKLVRMACVMTGIKNAAGRGGMGAVMGSKNLKAVVARGNQGLEVHDAPGLFQTRLELQNYLRNSKVCQVLGKVGTPLLYENSNRLGAIRTHNSQLNSFADSLNASEVEKFTEKMVSCYNCVVHCRHRNILGGEGPEYSTLALLGANCGIANTAQVIELNNLVNDLGLDSSSTGTIIPWAIELYQQGIIDENLTGRPLEFGDFGLVKSLIEDIAERQGFGNLLAESTQAVKIFGEQSKDYLIAVKGLPQSDPHDIRYIKSFALGIAVSSRGADHLRGRPTLDILDLPGELTEKIYGSAVSPDPTAYDTKEKMVYYHENMYAVTDCLGICKFVCHSFNSPHLLRREHFSTLIEEATGLEFSPEDLLEAGKRVLDLERLINLGEGVTRADDTLPKRYFDEEMPAGNTKGHKIDRKQFEGLLSRYYRLRNWDENGRPAPERVAEIEGLAAMDLEAIGLEGIGLEAIGLDAVGLEAFGLEAVEPGAGGRGLHNG
ncbi:MAG: aldehyde ferredoxin oxidoreductase family protein [Clostridia bacterium]|nr:aldehyde ferredoxin oxidoreductase family protein [Clostridia bacterium]